MRIAVCTMAINWWYRDIVKYSIKSIQMYAEKHKYDFHIFYDEIYDGERDFPWYKIKVIQSILEKYDFVFWIDIDGFISRLELSVEYFINNYLHDKDILCGKDWGGILNTGVMIFRNTPFCHILLNEVWNNKEEYDKNFHEQASLGQIYETNRLDSQSKIVILANENQNVLFTYWANYHPNTSFFTHIARCAHDPIGFLYTLDCYCPVKMDEDKEGEFEDRLDWLTNIKRCREDIEKIIKYGIRIRESTRSLIYKEKFYKENLKDKIENSKLKKNL